MKNTTLITVIALALILGLALLVGVLGLVDLTTLLIAVFVAVFILLFFLLTLRRPEKVKKATTARLVSETGEIIRISHSPFIIGRGFDCDLQLAERDVLPRHASLIEESGIWRVQMSDASAVLLLNGQPVKNAPLKRGDTISIGLKALTFFQGEWS